jgi:hypothetical protein|tara:strand:+ start:522 stop:626 length:105 start_codon:yes stop_codon:yes gene_type:complete
MPRNSPDYCSLAEPHYVPVSNGTQPDENKAEYDR